MICAIWDLVAVATASETLGPLSGTIQIPAWETGPVYSHPHTPQ